MQIYKEKMRTEEIASGIDAEMTEINVMLEEICKKEEGSWRCQWDEKEKLCNPF